MKFPEEACDDGNNSDGDGCAHDCKLEAGFICTNDAADLGSSIQLPIVLRDFKANHPHFEVNPGTGVRDPGMVLVDLGANGKPVYNVGFGGNPPCVSLPCTGRSHSMDVTTANAADTRALTDAQITSFFNQWYVTDTAVNSLINREILSTLPLTETPAGSDTYQFKASGATQFFPLDGKGFNLTGTPGFEAITNGHNFHFTSEARQWFTYDWTLTPAPLLSFSGDDDVWVFVNGKLAVDIGGIHGELTGSVELLGTTGQSSCTRI